MSFEIEFSKTFTRRWRIDRALGEGACGRVYLAHDLELDRPVAIKVLLNARPESDELARFLEEARVAAALQHRHIVPVLASGTDGAMPYLVLQYVEGTDLGRELEARTRLPADETVRIVLFLLDALGCAHAAGIVHRDVKPGNVMLRAPDATPLLADFGLARSGTREGIQTQSGIILGTPLYLAPERILGQEATGAADLYAVACILYECLSGRPPITGPTVMDVIAGQLRDTPPPLASLVPGVSPELAAVVHRGLEKKPEARFADAATMAAALAVALAEAPTKGVSLSRSTRASSLPGTTPRDSGRTQMNRASGGARERPVSGKTAPVVSSGAARTVSRGSGRSIRPAAPPARDLTAYVLAGLLFLAVGGVAAFRMARPSRPVGQASYLPLAAPPIAVAGAPAVDRDEALARRLIDGLAKIKPEDLMRSVAKAEPVSGKSLLRTGANYIKTPMLDPGPGIPTFEPDPARADRCAEVLRAPILNLHADLRKLETDRHRLFSPKVLPPGLARDLYRAIAALEPLDLALRNQHQDRRVFGWTMLRDPLVISTPATFPTTSSQREGNVCGRTHLRLGNPSQKEADEDNFKLKMYMDTAGLTNAVFGPDATSDQRAKMYRTYLVDGKMPQLPGIKSAGRARLVATVAMLPPGSYLEVELPKDLTRPAVQLNFQHTGSRDLKLAMDTWNVTPGYDPYFAPPESLDQALPKARLAIEFPASWLPVAASTIQIRMRTLPGLQRTEVSEKHSSMILEALDLEPAGAEVPGAPPEPSEAALQELDSLAQSSVDSSNQETTVRRALKIHGELTRVTGDTERKRRYFDLWQRLLRSHREPKAVAAKLEVLCRESAVRETSWLVQALAAVAAEVKGDWMAPSHWIDAMDLLEEQRLNERPWIATTREDVDTFLELLRGAKAACAGLAPDKRATVDEHLTAREASVRSRHAKLLAKLATSPREGAGEPAPSKP